MPPPLITYGCELTDHTKTAERYWFTSELARNYHVAKIALWTRRQLANLPVKVSNLVKLDDTAYVEDGPPTLHVQWRKTVFRGEDKTSYLDQDAIIELVSGHIWITDKRHPFNVNQYKELSKLRVLDEKLPRHYGTQRWHTFWPAVRPATTGEETCHYVVVSDADKVTLQSPDCSPDVPAGVDR